jgi:hypothetical protein
MELDNSDLSGDLGVKRRLDINVDNDGVEM